MRSTLVIEIDAEIKELEEKLSNLQKARELVAGEKTERKVRKPRNLKAKKDVEPETEPTTEPEWPPKPKRRKKADLNPSIEEPTV